MSDHNFFNTVHIDLDNALYIAKCTGIKLCVHWIIISVCMVK